MKKYAKKLSLNRETLRHLQSGEVIRAVGGSANCTSVVCVEATACECASQGGSECYPYTACFGTCSCAGTLDRTC